MSPAAGRHVEAKEIAGLTRLLPEFSPMVTKTAFFLVTFLIPLELVWGYFLLAGLWLWLVAAAFFSLAALGWVKLNVMKLLWLISELRGPVQFSYGTPHDRNYPPTGEHSLDVQRIGPGDLICASRKHARLVDSYEQQPEQWNKRNLIGCYDLVLISASESGRTVLGILGEAEPRYGVPGKDEYFARTRPLNVKVNPRRDPALSAEAGKALTDLLDLLPGNGEAMREDAAVRFLVSEHRNSDWSARIAIRLAISAKLAGRERSGVTIERIKIFASPTASSGHASCQLRLTEMGQLWRRSKPQTAPDEIPSRDPFTFGGNVSYHYHGDNIRGDKIVNTGPGFAMGRGSKGNRISQQWQQANINPHDLAVELATLIATLQPQATDPDQIKAVQIINSARNAAEKGDKDKALRHLSKLGVLAKWVLSTATAIGVGLAVTAINLANTPR